MMVLTEPRTRQTRSQNAKIVERKQILVWLRELAERKGGVFTRREARAHLKDELEGMESKMKEGTLKKLYRILKVESKPGGLFVKHAFGRREVCYFTVSNVDYVYKWRLENIVKELEERRGKIGMEDYRDMVRLLSGRRTRGIFYEEFLAAVEAAIRGMDAAVQCRALEALIEYLFELPSMTPFPSPLRRKASNKLIKPLTDLSNKICMRELFIALWMLFDERALTPITKLLKEMDNESYQMIDWGKLAHQVSLHAEREYKCKLLETLKRVPGRGLRIVSVLARYPSFISFTSR